MICTTSSMYFHPPLSSIPSTGRAFRYYCQRWSGSIFILSFLLYNRHFLWKCSGRIWHWNECTHAHSFFHSNLELSTCVIQTLKGSLPHLWMLDQQQDTSHRHNEWILDVVSLRSLFSSIGFKTINFATFWILKQTLFVPFNSSNRYSLLSSHHSTSSYGFSPQRICSSKSV